MNDSATSRPPGRAWVILLSLLAGMSLLYWLWASASTVAEIGKPFPGFLVEQCLDVATVRPPGWTGSNAGLVSYDLLVSANGVPLETPLDLRRLVRSVPVGTPITYELDRKGRRLALTIPTQPFGLKEFNHGLLPILASGILMMLVGIVAFWLKPAHPAAQAHLLMTLTGGVTLASVLDEFVGQHLGQYANGLMFFFGGALIHLALAFPTVPEPVQRRQWLLSLPHLASICLFGWVVLTTRAVGVSADPRAVASFMAFQQVFAVWIAAGLFSLMARTLLATVKATTPLARSQARIVLFGTVLGFSPLLLAWLLPELLGTTAAIQDWMIGVEILGYHVFPLVMTYAILRHRLFDVSWVARRAMLYLLLVGLLGGAYGLLSLLGAGYLDQHEPTFYTPLVVIALVVATRPLHEWLKRRIDRLFLGDRAEGMRLLAGFAVHGPAETSEVARQLREVIQRAIRPAWATVRLGDQVWGKEGGDEVPLALELPLGERGALRLGPKNNGFSYHAEETQLLEVASAQAAIAFENLHLYQERERLVIQEAVNSALATQRGQILSEVLHDLGNDLFRIQIAAATLTQEPGAHSRADSIAESLSRIEALLDEKRRWLTGEAPPRQSASLKSGIDGALNSLHPQLSERGQHVDILGLHEDGEVALSPVELGQVLVNLLGNASKFSPTGTRIRLECRHVDDRWIVRVADQGPGIPEPLLPRLGSGERGNAGIPGQGMGLRNVLGILERAGGGLQWGNHAAGAWIEASVPCARDPVS